MARQDLFESEERYRNLVECAQDGILVHVGLVYQFANQAAACNLGVARPEDLVGRSIFDFIQPDTVALTRRRLAQLNSGGGSLPPRETKRIRPDGSVVDVEISAATITFDGKRAIQVIMRDITARKKADEELRHRYSQLTALEQVIQAMATTVEIRDPYTAGHQRQVASLASAIAKVMGLSARQVMVINLAATVHDVGKVAIPSEILSRPGALGQYERRIVEGHARAGYDILRTIDFPWPIAQIVLQHHERMDGSGYPARLRGDDILLEARILAVADVVDAMVSHRPYRAALQPAVALAEIALGSGSLYDAKVAAACVGACATRFQDVLVSA